MDPSQPKGSYWLVGLAGNDRRVRLSADGPLLVGRGAHNHLVLNDYRISRQHSRVAHERDGFVVYDLNSANGTFVNGVAVRRQPIKPNDEVRFGPHGFRVELELDQPTGMGPAAPVKWRPAESITQFFRVSPKEPTWEGDNRDLAAQFAPPTLVPPTTQNARDTIPPEGPAGAEGFFVEDVVFPEDPVPPSRESARFRAAATTVDLNHLEDAYEKLGTMYAFMQAISKTIHKRELLELIAGKILEIYPAARSVGIYLRAAPDKNVPASERPFQLIHFAGAEETTGRSPTLRDATSKAVLRARRAIFSEESAQGSTWGTTMYAPMLDREDALGVIYVAAGDPNRGAFTVADLELLNGIAVPAAIMLQNTRMHEESLQRERLNRDLELAAQIQKSFLPREVLSVPGIEFLATYKAAYTVGGDFYDVFWVGPDLLAVFIGDISGKGVAAALLMARISGELHVAALAHVDPVSVFTIMNKAVINRGQPELFFTAIYFTLDVKTGEIWLATAGQPSPYLCRADGTVEAITEGASGAVGMLEDQPFTATRLVLANGDSLVLYTDGVVEAAALDGSLYGDERLAACLQAAGPRPQDISEQILRSVGQHTLTAPANDDLTIFVCHRAVGSPPSLQPRRHSTMPELPKVTREVTAQRSDRRVE